MRKAEIDDVEALAVLINSAYRGESSKKGWTTEADILGGIRTDAAQLKETILEPHTTILIWENGQQIEACIQIVEKEAKLYVGMLTVDPEKQGKGYGKKLLKAAENFARDRKVSKLEMTVITDRVELIAWYERHGYIKTGETRPFPMGSPKFGEPKKFLEFLVLEKVLVN